MTNFCCSLTKFLGLFIAVVTLSARTTEAGVIFDLSYDNFPNGIVGDTPIVGSGTLSYDGVLTAGRFALSDLPNLAFEASFAGAGSWSLSMLSVPLSDVEILVSDLGDGSFSMVFTGDDGRGRGSAATFSSLLPLTHISQDIPFAIGQNLYIVGNRNFFGDYIGIATAPSVIPEPTSFALWSSLGMIGMLVSRSRRR